MTDMQKITRPMNALTLGSPNPSPLTVRSGIASPVTVAGVEDTVASREKRHLNNRITEAHSLFVETKAFRYARDTLADVQHLILLDAPGCGKTTISLMLMRKYIKKKYRYYFIDSNDDFNVIHDINTRDKNVLIFDDFFGKSGLKDFVKLSKTLQDLDSISSKLNNLKHGEDSQHDLKVIFTSRNYIFAMAKPQLGQYKRTIMKNSNVINLSEYPLTETERKQMLLKHCQSVNIEMSEEKLGDIVKKTENTIGFPYSCKMFSKVNVFQKMPESYFSTPFIYLKDHLAEILLKGTVPGQASALVLMFLLEGKLMIRDLDPWTRKEPKVEEYMNCLYANMTKEPHEITQGAVSLEGSFLERNNQTYVFTHPAVYDAIASIMGKKDPNLILKHCQMSFILEYVHLETNKSGMNKTDDYECSVTIPEVHTAMMVKRFADEIKERNFRETLPHDVFQEETFVDDVIEELESDDSLPDIFHKCDRTHGHCFLFWATLYSTPQIVKTSQETNFVKHFLVQKACERSEFNNSELLAGFLGCALSGNMKSFERIIENKNKSSNLENDNVASATVEEIIKGNLLRSLSEENEQNSQFAFFGNQRDGLLHVACIHGYADIVKEFLKLGCIVNGRGELGRTPLMYASRYGHEDVVNILLDFDADINLTDDEGASALHLAARGGHISVMKMFTDHGVDINERGEHQRTPLLYACRYGYYEFVKFCLDNGGDLSLKCDYDSCLHLACISGRLDTVKLLVEKGMDVNEPGQFSRSPVMFAIRHGNIEIVEYLKEHGADLNIADDKGETAFSLAVVSGNVELAKQFLPIVEGLENVCDKEGLTPFEKASALGHTDMIKYFMDNNREVLPLSRWLIAASYKGRMDIIKLLVKQCDINEKGHKGRTALITACLGGQAETAEFLIENEAEVNLCDECDNNCWNYACSSGSVDLVKVLLKKGFTLKTRCQNEKTALMCACRTNSCELFEFLLEADKKSVETLDKHGLNCLHHCCFSKSDSPVLLEKLIALGLDVNSRDDSLKTPAMYACRNGLTKILKCLIKHNANLELKDKNDQNCLHFACWTKRRDIVQILIDHGLNINCIDNNKTTPLMVASYKGNPAVAEFLLENGADVNKQNSFARNCVHEAAKERQIPVLEVFIKHGVDMYMEGKYGRTPFLCACQYGNTDVVEFFKKHDVRVLDRDSNGANGLHLCCMGKKDTSSVARKLIHYGINVNDRDNNGMSPIMYACLHGNEVLFNFLYSKGASIHFQDKHRRTCLQLARRGGNSRIEAKIREYLN